MRSLDKLKFKSIDVLDNPTVDFFKTNYEDKLKPCLITYDKMKTFEAKGNSKSIWNNPVLGGRVPKEDLIEAIKNNTYQSMGINMTEDDAKSMDPTKDTPITDSDVEAIVDEIINNQPELRSNLLTEYLTNLSRDIYLKSLDQDVLRSMFPSTRDVQFMSPEEGQQLQERIDQDIEEQKKKFNKPSLYQGGKV